MIFAKAQFIDQSNLQSHAQAKHSSLQFTAIFIIKIVVFACKNYCFKMKFINLKQLFYIK
ncbi:hypothetical protein BKG96_08765 [Rodentibacter caecimuris]|uniref:Uncharacterized protein n=1 Tax=Rodentibacter caecimuris TaxID=1796644 RepID=A0A1V3KXN4_9PAST|nr:hypothetical protein BKG96_08765 [Rodentibacter heylii]OOF82401.1 hypothetical protein BKG97_00700 [Rodentibacter heylii]